MTIQLSSSAFSDGGTIPQKHTCDGEDRSPALSWSSLPTAVKSLALIVDDPDAPSGTFVHWVIYNIPASLNGLPEGVAKADKVEGIGTQGINGFRRTGYNGPCPPRGPAHRYFFKLYALDTSLNLKAGVNKSDLENALRSHVLAQGQIIGKYGR